MFQLLTESTYLGRNIYIYILYVALLYTQKNWNSNRSFTDYQKHFGKELGKKD